MTIINWKILSWCMNISTLMSGEMRDSDNEENYKNHEHGIKNGEG